ncbi:MAG: N-acetyltransferase, partial [bacterium]|nr:N-acetyltransferase [bacterium]
MPAVEIQAVQTSRQQKQFLNFPWELYANDPNWVPPMRSNNRDLVGYGKHPFYDDAESQTFLAIRDGKVCGRIAAIVNHVHNKKYKEKRGIIGFYESIDDQDVANELFKAAIAWFRQQGMTELRGPINPSLNYECGMLIDGFDSPPTFMMTYNPPYYEKLWLEFGFEKSQNLFAYYGHVDMLESLDKKMEFIIEEATRRLNVQLRQIDTKNLEADVRMFLDIYNKSL